MAERVYTATDAGPYLNEDHFPPVSGTNENSRKVKANIACT